MKVLVADDDELMREVMLEFIKNTFSCDVEAAFDGLEAIKKINQGYFDLVISDFNMPRANGIEVFSYAKAQLGRKAKIIIMSGESERFVREAGIKLPEFFQEVESCFIEKPFQLQELKVMIKKVMAR